MGIYWRNIDPEMQILGPTQQFIFGQNLNQFQIDNTFVPTSLVPSQNLFELRNNGLSGFRFRHETAFGDTHGTLKIQSFLNGSTTGTDILTFDESGVLNILPPTSFNNLSLAGNLDMGNFKIINLADPINPQDGATRSWVLSQIDNTFGPAVALPFAQLNFNWANGSGGTPYIFNHAINDSAPFFKKHIYQVTSVSPDVQRTWQALYSLGDPNAWNPEYSLTFYHPIFSPGGTTPFQLLNIGGGFSPVWGLFVRATIDMDGFEIKNALNPTTAQSLTTRFYVDNAVANLPSVINVSGTTQTFNYSNALSSSIFSLTNTNASAVTYFKAGTSTDSVQLGYDGSNDYSFLNIQGASNDRLAFRANGVDIAALLQSGLFGLGTITPTLGKLQIVGGVQNIVGEDTAIRVSSALSNVKIELHNTAVGGKLFEIRSGSTGQFDITDRTGSATRFTISSAGNIGINMGLSLPNAPLQFSNNVVNRKIVLFESANNDHQFTGLGLNTNSFRFQVPSTADSWNFLAGLSSASSQVAAQITGTGNIIIPGTYFGRSPSGMVYMEGNVTTTALTANVWAKIAGTTTASGFLNQFTSPVSNRLTYTGTTQVIALINASTTLNFSAGGGGTVRSISIFKNGIQITPSLMSEDIASGTNINMSTQAFVSLTTNDYIEVYCRSSSNSNVTASNLILTTTAS